MLAVLSKLLLRISLLPPTLLLLKCSLSMTSLRSLFPESRQRLFGDLTTFSYLHPCVTKVLLSVDHVPSLMAFLSIRGLNFSGTKTFSSALSRLSVVAQWPHLSSPLTAVLKIVNVQHCCNLLSCQKVPGSISSVIERVSTEIDVPVQIHCSPTQMYYVNKFRCVHGT